MKIYVLTCPDFGDMSPIEAYKTKNDAEAASVELSTYTAGGKKSAVRVLITEVELK